MADKIIAADITTLDTVALATLINQAVQIPNQTFRQVLGAYCNLMKFVWQPAGGLTPQQILTNMHQGGVPVVKLMEFGVIALSMIRQVVAMEGLTIVELQAMVGAEILTSFNANAFFDGTQSPIPGGQGLTPNQDGSLTVTSGS